MKFTDKYIANLKPKAKMYQQREGKGFGVRVLPSGHKIWIFTYTHDGKRRQMNLGSYPEKSLVDARAAHAAAYAALNDPTNPRDPQTERDQTHEAERQAREERRKAPTVEDLADEYMKKHAIPNKKTWKRDEFCLNNDILPALGEIKAQDVRKRDVVLLLEKIVERGAPGQARSVLEVMRRMFTFAVERDILETSPMFGVKPLTKKVARDRVLTADEIKTFWAGLDTAAMSDEIKRALRLILLTGARPGEVIGMDSDEIDGDWWQIPASRSKNGIVHRVFLTETAKELIGELTVYQPETGETVPKGFIFPSPRVEIDPVTEKPIYKPIDVNALAYAIRRNLKGLKRQRKARANHDQDTPVMVDVPEESKIDMGHFTPHDLRRTAATMLAELGFTNETIDAILGHKARGVVAVYNRHDYSREKQKAMQALERKLQSITTGKQGKVLPLQRKG